MNDLNTDKLVEDLSKVGAAWASYGLKIGESALEASAETLKHAATILARIAESLRGPIAPPEPPSPTAPAAEQVKQSG